MKIEVCENCNIHRSTHPHSIHTHSTQWTSTNQTLATSLAASVVKEFAKPDADADLTEWRKKYIG